MGERKGQNFYYPPDFDYKKHGGLNRYHGTHALRERASKIHLGILTIRFEMPFNVWCLGCQNHVGMGVRYNAEKKKVGMYYTTPIYEFRMKCHLCDNYYVIRTDPKNFDYELVEGLSRQEKRYDPSTIDQLGAVDRTFNQKLSADAMFKQEHQYEDKKTAESEEERIEKLEWLKERDRDWFQANSVLRASFRKEKVELNEQRAKDDDLKKRACLDIKLLPESPEDKRVAAMLSRYKDVKSDDIRHEEARARVESDRIFSSAPSTSSDSKCTTSAERLKHTLKRERNKQINDQFHFDSKTSNDDAKKQRSDLGIVIKKKKVTPDHILPHNSEGSTTPVEKISTLTSSSFLVADYGTSSDSDGD